MTRIPEYGYNRAAKAARKGVDVVMYEQKPLQHQAYDYLTQQIKAGALKPGVIYSETRIAAEIGISRTPMKDALVRLAQDRYVDIIPSKGFCLHTISAQDIENTYEVRSAIETFCAVDLFRYRDTAAGKKALRQLKDSLDRQEQALEDNSDIQKFYDYDDQFHQTILLFTNNPEFQRLHGTFSHRISELANATLRKPGRMERAMLEHRLIYDSLQRDDLTALYLAVSRHLEITRDLSLEIQSTG